MNVELTSGFWFSQKFVDIWKTNASGLEELILHLTENFVGFPSRPKPQSSRIENFVRNCIPISQVASENEKCAQTTLDVFALKSSLHLFLTTVSLKKKTII